jgi:hypothetical protein
MPSFIPAIGRTQHVAGVCLNRIGKPDRSPIGAPRQHNNESGRGHREVAPEFVADSKESDNSWVEHIAVDRDDIWLTVRLNASFRPGGRASGWILQCRAW